MKNKSGFENVEAYLCYIKEVMAENGDILFNPEWVVEMLENMIKANQLGATINPKWLRASRRIIFQGQENLDTWMFKKP